MMNTRAVLTIVLALSEPCVAAAQLHSGHEDASAVVDSNAIRFVAEARAGTSRYHDQAAAIADGYRRVGPELPSMGEHWLNIRLILADSVDAAHPSILIYVTSPAGPSLVGVAYTRMLRTAEPFPDFPRGLDAWHDHSGLLEDEALPTAHVRQLGRDTARASRLGFLHLWIWCDNPAGAWTADNWSLPFARAGLRAAVSDDQAARSLALAADSGRYYLETLTAVSRADRVETTRLREVLAAGAAKMRGLSLSKGELTEADVARLRSAWQSLWADIATSLPPDKVRRLEELRRLWW